MLIIPSMHHTDIYTFRVVQKACKYIGVPSRVCPHPTLIPLISHTRIAFFPHKCAGTHSLSSFLCCCLGAEPSRSLPITCHRHPSPNSLLPVSNPSLLAA